MCLASRSFTEIRLSQFGITSYGGNSHKISINHGQIMSKWWSHRVVQGFLLQYPLQAAKTRWHFYCVAWWESQVSLCENEGTVYLLTYINLEPGFFGVYWVYLIYSYILLIQNTYILYVVVFFYTYIISSWPHQCTSFFDCCSWRPCLSTFAQNGHGDTMVALVLLVFLYWFMYRYNE